MNLLAGNINDQTGTTYSLVLADTHGIVTLSNSDTIVLTIPANSSIAFPKGSRIILEQIGGGTVTIAVAGGVTVNSLSGNLNISGLYGVATLSKIGTDSWIAYGNLV